MTKKIILTQMICLILLSVGCSKKTACIDKYDYVMNITTKSHDYVQKNTIECCIAGKLEKDSLCIPKERNIITPPPYRPLYKHEYSQYDIEKVQ